MFKTKKCFICSKKDQKVNMRVAHYGIYNDSKRWFHPQCAQDVVCYPEDHSNNIVDRALWCLENLHQILYDEKKENEKRAVRLTKAQETLEC